MCRSALTYRLGWPCLQAKDAEDEAAVTAAMSKGMDAFAELKKMAAAPVSDPAADKRRLLADAAEGLTVAGRPATWLQDRPKLLPVGQAVKSRGFATYDRCARLAKTSVLGSCRDIHISCSSMEQPCTGDVKPSMYIQQKMKSMPFKKRHPDMVLNSGIC